MQLNTNVGDIAVGTNILDIEAPKVADPKLTN